MIIWNSEQIIQNRLRLKTFIYSVRLLKFIVNVVCSSNKRHDELQNSILDDEISHLLKIGELDSVKGQISLTL
jgi:ferritin-like protein